MSGKYVIVSSITYAYKGKSALERKGIKVDIEKAPKEISECGCQYALKILNAPLYMAVEILNNARVKIITTGGS